MKELFGWTGKMLRINLSNHSAAELSSMIYASRFIGGRGLASRMYWDELNPPVSAFNANNHLYFMTGPLCGTLAPAASRWIVLGKSPMAVPEQYASANLGGRFGAVLKWAGLDGLDIYGASQKPVFLVIEPNGTCRFEDAGRLWGKDCFDTIVALEKQYGDTARVAAISRAGEMKIRFANIIGSDGVSATKGFGAVMGSKNLKAIVVRAEKAPLRIARPKAFKQVRKDITALWSGEASGRFWNELSIEDIKKKKNIPCYACPGICRRGLYESKGGEHGIRKPCVSAYFYYKEEMAKTGRMAETTFHATQVANRHGLCMLDLRFMLFWLPEAIRLGLVDPKATGLELDLLGTPEWIDNLSALIISRKGVGELLAEGSRRATKELGIEKLLDGLVTKTGFDADYYNPRLFILNAPIYATEPVYPITQLHRVSFPMVKWMVWMGTEGMTGFLTTEKLRNMAKIFWGNERAAEFDSPDYKGAAAVLMQNRAYAMENMVFCDWFWPIDFTANTETGVGDPELEGRLFSAVTGLDMDESVFLQSGERCANLCRALYLREGRRGRVDDVLEEFNFTTPLLEQDPPVGLFNADLVLPGKDGEFFSRKGETVSREMFKKVMDDYYSARGWDVETGLPTQKKLTELDLEDIVPALAKSGLIK